MVRVQERRDFVQRLTDDRRVQLPKGNMFRYCQPERVVLPHRDDRVEIRIRTAHEVERERIAGKQR